jgi:hypothetical protein
MRFVLIVESKADRDRGAMMRRLRAALKVLWRCFQLRCVELREEQIK